MTLKLIESFCGRTLFMGALLAFASCQPKAQYDVITDPMKSFVQHPADSLRGASSLGDLSCFLFIALQQPGGFDHLLQVIPDSNDIAAIYVQTNAPSPMAGEIRTSEDSVLQSLKRGFMAAQSKAAVLHSDWKEASLTRVLVIDIEGQKLPSKKIVLEAKQANNTLRASARCLKIGNRWFIGEELRYGV